MREFVRLAGALLLLFLILRIRVKLDRLQRPSVAPPSWLRSFIGASELAYLRDYDFFYTIHQAPDKRDNFLVWMQEATWHVPFKDLPFTPVLSCEPGHSALFNRFDWQVVPPTAWEIPRETFDSATEAKNNMRLAGCHPVNPTQWRNGSTEHPNPKTVWAVAHGVERLLRLAEERLQPDDAGERTVVFSGTEMPLSWAFGRSPVERNATIMRLRRYFKRIIFQIKDIELEHVLAAPMGFCWGYFMQLLPKWALGANTSRRRLAKSFMEFSDIIGGSVENKTKGILAPGAFVASWLEEPRIPRMCRYYDKVGVLFPPSNTSTQVIVDAYESRRQMRSWAESSAARAAGVEFRKVPVSEWYFELSQYRFLMSPIGSAIQSAKTYEALSVLTVPIIVRMNYVLHDELVSLGFPMVVIEGWAEITKGAVDRWWKALSPRLESFRRNCLTVDGYWRMYTGQTTYCS
uniref:Exostosin GT47 domain-containing protein n=1 Tax=Alexandrium andersonii TaxID=327968 RepID=A0A7S2CJ90_9DINO|mmetsp:Transcript_39457/g.89721  ORF Transcript_39457/g.89721 Transcript_39457/m.89721 type:complete len:461 (+) Transcript_39457:156-1538(+)